MEGHKRSTGKGARAATPAPKRIRCKLSLSPATVKWLKVHALGLGLGDRLGLVVDELVSKAPTRFILSERGGGSSATEGHQRQEGQEPRQGPPSLGLLSEAS